MKDSDFRKRTGKVREFYESCSFPGYEDCETPFDLVEKAGSGVYAKLLDQQLPISARILDAGCGTGQLTLFLSMLNRRVVGIDLSRASLRKGQTFKSKFQLDAAQFVHMNIFDMALKPESFDYVFSNGVLHHTPDAYGGFQVLCRLLKKGGYFILGLYNTYGRLLLDARRVIFKWTGPRLLALDAVMRSRSVGQDKKRIWFADQYLHPLEEKYSVEDVLRWFAQNDLEYINSIPKVNLKERLTLDEQLFEPHDPGTKLDHLITQLSWIFTKGKEGGFFIIIGRKR